MSLVDTGDQIERILFICRNVKGESASTLACAACARQRRSKLTTEPMALAPGSVYKIPPRPSLSGWKAQDWGENSFIWEGRLRIVESGNKAVLKLEVCLHLLAHSVRVRSGTAWPAPWLNTRYIIEALPGMRCEAALSNTY